MSEITQENYPILFGIAKSQGVKRTCHVYDNYRVFPSGAAPVELGKAQQAGLISNIIKSEVEDPNEGRLVGAYFFEFTPLFAEPFLAENRQKRGPKTNETQITINDKTRYITDRARMILDANIGVLADTAYGDLNQIRKTRNKKVRRRLIAELHDIMLLRDKELPRHLYGSICLRLGMPLPSDFWTAPLPGSEKQN